MKLTVFISLISDRCRAIIAKSVRATEVTTNRSAHVQRSAFVYYASVRMRKRGIQVYFLRGIFFTSTYIFYIHRKPRITSKRLRLSPATCYLLHTCYLLLATCYLLPHITPISISIAVLPAWKEGFECLRC